MKPLFVLLSVFVIGLLLRSMLHNDWQMKRIARIAMSAMLLFTGIAHFAFAEGMAAMLPEIVPARVLLVQITGVLEIAAALCLLIDRYSRSTGILLIIFFLAVLPANIYAAIHHIDPTTGASDGHGVTYLIFRIPLQVLFILWVWWSAVRTNNSPTTKHIKRTNMKTSRTISMVALLFSSVLTFGQTTEQVAKDYVDAYIELRFDDLQHYYTNASFFQDPTLALIDPQAGEKVIGPAAILEKLDRNFNGVHDQRYTLNEHYTVGEYSIFIGLSEYTQNATAFGGPDVDIRFALKSTTIIKVVNGKVVEHIDYIDYTSWFQQFEAQKSKR